MAGKARNLNKAQTLPYLAGQDLLPVGNFDSHAEVIGRYKDVFNALVTEFLSTYEKARDAQQLRLGDILTHVDGERVTEFERAVQLLGDAAEGEEVQLGVLRHGDELAELALPGLPTNKRGINLRASEERWASRVGNDGEVLVRKRTGRGAHRLRKVGFK